MNKQSSGQSPEVFNRNKFFFYLNENLRFSNFPCFTPRQASENSLINISHITIPRLPLQVQLEIGYPKYLFPFLRLLSTECFAGFSSDHSFNYPIPVKCFGRPLVYNLTIPHHYDPI